MLLGRLLTSHPHPDRCSLLQTMAGEGEGRAEDKGDGVGVSLGSVSHGVAEGGRGRTRQK